MPQNRGARYFEEQPESPDKRQAHFHEVFGHRQFRTFQPGGPNSDRWNSRGSGRGRGYAREQGRGNARGRRDMGNTSSSGRNRNPVAGQPDHRESGRPFSTDARTPDISSSGNKRPSFDQSGSEGRRKKRYVPGGLIPKFRRVNEYKGETFCEVCNEGFRDVNAKALHDRSFKHRRNYCYLRHENEHRTNDDMSDFTNQNQESEEDRRKKLDEAAHLFKSIDRRKFPKDFDEWANRSITEGKKAADEANDPSLLQAVIREIVDVFRVNDANCTLRRVCWTRRELATGRSYRSLKPTTQGLPVIQDSKIHAKAPIISKKEEEKPKADKSRPAIKHRSPPRDIVEVVDVDHNVTPQVTAPPNNSQPNESIPAQQERPTYPVVQSRSRLSRAAEMIHSACEIHDREGVLRSYYTVFDSEKARGSDREQKKSEEPESIETVMTTYRELRLQFESEEFEYDDIMTGLSTVAKQLEQLAKHIDRLRQIYRTQIEIALQCGEFRDCYEPCSRFVGTYSRRRYVQGTSAAFVGHWLLSLFFQNDSRKSRKGFPEILEIAQEMRKFPVGASEDVWVYEAIQAVKAILGNNWCGFFGRSLSSIVHIQRPTSKLILEGIVPFMRESALIVMTHMRVCANPNPGADGPKDIRAKKVRMLLGWGSKDDVRESIEEMKEFVSSLSHELFEMTHEEDNSAWIHWKGKPDDDLTLSGDSDVREGMLGKWSKPLVLEDED